ncbi:uncharacterized protein EAF01_003415 [Botrytis porri]|uniref:Uncharacterized protein n=1 Tax=Botrytis porri TaxID=87229 RepID=A0A4Z1L3I1_9HELO|nr:uncharacterized protein EAF01_003415 [Botrytis porri]KAF7909697.1 hypothetical protein EAF01_003415 [Botrytis porri]TGO91339.1 hypothetical protein BPOR_0031g00280 [Botrytis porri]
MFRNYHSKFMEESERMTRSKLEAEQDCRDAPGEIPRQAASRTSRRMPSMEKMEVSVIDFRRSPEPESRGGSHTQRASREPLREPRRISRTDEVEDFVLVSSRTERHKSSQRSRRAPSMERMQVSVHSSDYPRPVLRPVPRPVFPIVASSKPPTLPTSSASSSMRMSANDLEGSEYLEPTLAESTFARQSVSSTVLDPGYGTVSASSKPWGNAAKYMEWGNVAQYMGLKGGRSGAENKKLVTKQPGANRAPIYTPQRLESDAFAIQAPLTAKEQELRERIARKSRENEERERRETEAEDAAIDNVEFGPTIPPYTPKYQSSFANRKGFSSPSEVEDSQLEGKNSRRLNKSEEDYL